jgi:ABC-type transporter Mla MlaB component
MTLRITVIPRSPPTTLKVDGRLTRAEVPELRSMCAEVEGALALDLTYLQSADREGVSLLRELREKSADLIGLSPFLQLLLERQSHDAGN